MKPKVRATKKQSKNPTLLTPAQLKSRQSQLTIIDVRGVLEYWMGHIPGAQCLNRDRILKEIPKDQAIAAHWLVSQGYSQIYNLQGGLLAWQEAGYPVQRGGKR